MRVRECMHPYMMLVCEYECLLIIFQSFFFGHLDVSVCARVQETNKIWENVSATTIDILIICHKNSFWRICVRVRMFTTLEHIEAHA